MDRGQDDPDQLFTTAENAATPSLVWNQVTVKNTLKLIEEKIMCIV